MFLSEMAGELTCCNKEEIKKGLVWLPVSARVNERVIEGRREESTAYVGCWLDTALFLHGSGLL